MDQISSIINKINLDSQQYRDNLMIETTKQLEEINASYNFIAEKEFNETMNNANQESNMFIERGIAQDKMNLRNQKLASKRKVIDNVFSKAKLKLNQMPIDDKIKLYSILIQKYQTVNKAELILNNEDKELLGLKLISLLTVSNLFKGKFISIAKHSGDFIGGFILKEDNIETNCTFEVLVENFRDELEFEIVNILFNTEAV